MYRVDSSKAEEFIHHGEITGLARLRRRKCRQPTAAGVDPPQGGGGRGLTHREALLLLDTRDEELTERMFALARAHQGAHLRNRIVHVRAALPVELLCVNGCVYCPYHLKNKHIPAFAS